MKLKTHKATAKRIQATKTGKLMRMKAARSHLLTHKSTRSKVKVAVENVDLANVKRLAPYL